MRTTAETTSATLTLQARVNVIDTMFLGVLCIWQPLCTENTVCLTFCSKVQWVF